VELQILDVEALAEERVLFQDIGVVRARDEEQLADAERHELPERRIIEGTVERRAQVDMGQRLRVSAAQGVAVKWR
jgi:hypothetical protein